LFVLVDREQAIEVVGQ